MVLAPIHTFDARALTVFNNQAGDAFVHQNDATVSLDVAGQGLREGTRPSLWDTPRRGTNRSVGQTAGHGILRRLMSKRTGEQKGAAVIVLEIVANDLPLRHSSAALPKMTRSEERRVGKECRSRWSP